MPTRLTVTGVGTFSAAYDSAGAMVQQTLPGGLSQTTSYDDAGEPVGLSYSGQVTSTDPDTGQVTVSTGPWLAWSQDNDITGRVRREWTPAGAAFTDGPDQGDPNDVGDALSYDRGYIYDRAGRLSAVRDRTASVTGAAAPDDPTDATTACTTRTYGFDKNGNRSALTETPAAADGSCSTSTTPTKARTWTYDTADRSETASGYSYDLLGRAVNIPATDASGGTGSVAVGYYDSDAARSIAHAGQTVTFTQDAAGRPSTATTEQ